MKPRGILSCLSLLVLLSACASAPTESGDEYEDETASSEESEDSSQPASPPSAESSRAAESATPEAPGKSAAPAVAEATPAPKPPAPPAPPVSAPGSKHDVLSHGFDRATLLPEISDFDLLDDPRPMNRCLASRPADPDRMMDMVIRQMSVPYPGTPSYGPLFPGAGPRVETSLVIGRDNGWVTANQLTEEKRRVFELHQLGNTLVLKILPNPFGIYQDFGNPAEVWIRKSQDGNLFFKVFKMDGEQNRAEAFVGYCFKKT